MSRKSRRLMSLFGSSKTSEAARQQARKRRERRKLFMEPLEDRRLLAVLTESGTTLTINLNNPGEEFTIASLTNTPASLNVAYALGSTSSFDFSGITAGRVKTFARGIAITRAGQAAYDTINIIDSAQDTRVRFTTSAGDAYTENFTVTLDDDTSASPKDRDQGSVLFSGGGREGLFPFESNNLTISTTRSVIAGQGVRITTTDGNVSMSANAAGTTTGDFAGIVMGTARLESTGTGSISLVGHGGAGNDCQSGVRLVNQVKIRTTTGNIQIQGTGGDGTFNNDGVDLDGGVIIESTQGDVTISGQAGASLSRSIGVKLDSNSEIRSSGGAITVTGTGGTGTGAEYIGVSVARGSLIIATDSSISVTGRGGGTGTASISFGVRVDLSTIGTTNAGTITINGIGGGGTGNGNFGVYLNNVGRNNLVDTKSGAITINGTAGTGPSNRQLIGIKLEQGAIRTSGGPILINGKKPTVLMIDYSGVAGLEDVNVVFEGGGTGTNSGLFVSEGTFGRTEYAYVNANDGGIGNFADAAGTNLRSLIFYSGLSPITNNSTVTNVVFDLPMSGDVQAILEDDGTTGNTLSRFRSSPTAFEQTDFANPSGTVTINRGSATDDLTVNDLPDFDAGLKTGDALAPLDQVTFAGSVTLASGNSLKADTTTINFSTASANVALSGTGAAALTAAKNIAFVPGSSLTTVDGDITLSANAAGTSTGSFTGIDVAGGTVQSSGSGALSFTGHGGTGSSNLGVRVRTGGKVLGGSGNVTVQGTGGTGTGSPAGILVAGADAGVNSQIGSTGGNVTVIGQGGVGTSGGVNGVIVSLGGEISAGGTGEVTVSGTGGATAGNSNYGVFVSSADARITSSGGDVTVLGQGGGSGASASDYGIHVNFGGVITAGGTGNVNVFGLGGNGTGSGQAGVVVNGTGSQITSNGGDVSVLALGGVSGDNAHGVWVENGSSITAGGAGSVNVAGIGGGSGVDNTGVLISGTGSTVTTGAGGGDVLITGGSGVGTGQSGVALRNGGAFTTADGTITLDARTGAPSSGNIQLNGPVTSSGGDITIRADRDIVGDANGDVSTGPGGGNIVITADQDATGTPNDAGTIQTAGDVTAGTGTLTLSLTDCDGFMNGNIASASDVIKEGSGALRLSGADIAYTGTTNINAGTLLVNGALTADSDTVHVNNGGTLGGTGTIGSTPGARAG